jgi:ABC-type histidine transport system ATPase subunit
MWFVFTLRIVRGFCAARQGTGVRPARNCKSDAAVHRHRVFGVQKWFGTNHVLADIDLAVATGEVVVVIGPSGSGKSTLIRCINGLEAVQEGTVVVDGKRLTAKGGELAAISHRRLVRRLRRSRSDGCPDSVR